MNIWTPPPVLSLEAKLVIRELIHDMLNGQVPLTVRNFSELHDHVDANEYLIAAGLGYMTDAEMDASNGVCDEVNGWLERLKDRSESAIRQSRPVI